MKKNKIVFYNCLANGYGCNLKYITEEIVRRKLDYEIVWIIWGGNIDEKPQNVKIISAYNILFSFYALATAKLWVSNGRLNSFVSKGLWKKKEQKYINTWHGSLGIKRVDFDSLKWIIGNKELGFVIFNRESSYCDYAISNSEFESNVYKEGLNYRNVLELGHPRNDIFFKDNKNIKDKVYKKLGLTEDTKTILYAPSFRDIANMDWFNLDFEGLKKALDKKWGGDFVILTRLHPTIKELAPEYIPNFEYVIDANDYADIQELMVASDVMMTDYSSCIYDFLLTKKPGFIYASDVNAYDFQRGFYYPLSATPFPVATDNKELFENIEQFSENEYLEKVKAFLEDKKCMDDGGASSRVVDLIEEIMNS